MHRLFLSVDMTGSTEFKARFTGQGADGWLEIFRAFFANFPLMLAGQIGFEFLDDEITPEIAVWKTMGDEVIFTAAPGSAEELTGILLALLRTMAMYEEGSLQELPLRLKGAAWLAGFDGQNIEVEIPELSSGDGGVHLDFIGPDIDLGFRISKFARAGSLTLSLDVLELVLQAKNADRAALHLMGREALKGVMFGRAYPIVWMRDAEVPFAFLPWEVEQDPLVAAAAEASPTAPAVLRALIDDMRHYLKKMHGRDRPPVSLG